MSKVIDLEKDTDGTYKPTKVREVEVAEQEEILEKTVVMPKTGRIDNKKLSEMIVKHGSNMSEFLTGVQQASKLIRILSKLSK